ncbi:MAG: hypothetical protein BMS9Abin13_302 [Patescibacteria group bacterium]|nr:MAG: hypothetical protein BMS9Abin13_302 [Patescibacteria group bacterium]
MSKNAMNISSSSFKKHAGLSFVDVIIASALLLIVFVGIAGSFKTILVLASHNKAKIGALAIVDERMEFIRNLSYNSIGTLGGIPAGSIPQNESVSLNGINYNRRVLVQYVDAPEDGSAGSDVNGLTNDYKRVKVEATWTIRGSAKTVFLVSNFAPKSIETNLNGGTLIINVLDALGAPIMGANVHIENNTINPTVSTDVSTDIDGKVIFPGGTPVGSDYEITVTKTGYSTAKTYDSDASNPNPNPGHLSVVEGQTTVSTFQIDILGSKTVKTYEQIKSLKWEDKFDDTSNISSFASTTVSGGDLILSGGAGSYEPDGYAYSATVTPVYLYAWDEISWTDNKPPSTNIRYKVYDASGSQAVLIPNTYIPGNSSGLTTSPIDISGLATTTYPALQVAAFLSTSDPSTTPSLSEWEIKYSVGPIPLLNLAFNMRGDKTIGIDGGGASIYKYSQNLQTDAAGSLSIGSLEWDTYTITIDNAALGYDIGESCEPQPLSLLPGVSVATSLYFVPQTSNSLLVAVRDSSGALLSGVSARLYRIGVDITQTTSSCGQTFFAGISQGSISNGNAYFIDLSLAGYTNTTIIDIEVSGASNIDVAIDD